MTLTKVVSEQIAKKLREQILSGELMPGERIRQEEIAEAFNASRIPVREALRMLVTDGLVEVVSNSGAWVSGLTMAECLEQYMIRERIEPLLLRTSLEKFDFELVGQLEDLIDALESNQDVKTFMELDRKFHMLTYSAAPDTTLKEIVIRLWNTTQPYRRVYTQLVAEKGLSVSHLEHRLLLEAITRKDTEDAERILMGHIRRTRLALALHPEVFKAVND